MNSDEIFTSKWIPKDGPSVAFSARPLGSFCKNFVKDLFYRLSEPQSFFFRNNWREKSVAFFLAESRKNILSDLKICQTKGRHSASIDCPRNRVSKLDKINSPFYLYLINDCFFKRKIDIVYVFSFL